MIRAIIIDDEEHPAERLSILLKKNHLHHVQLVDVFDSVEKGLKGIQTTKPDVVFLDVHIHDKTGFDLLKQLNKIDFNIIFTTSFEKYALQAFKFNAVDYLLKPVDEDELKIAIEKITEKQADHNMLSRMENLLYNMNQTNVGSKKICVATQEAYHYINVTDIIRCEADGNYCFVYMLNHPKIHVSKTLTHFDEMLNEYDFIRVHQSHLINKKHIQSYNKGKGGVVTMIDGSNVEVSTRKKDEFLQRMAGS